MNSRSRFPSSLRHWLGAVVVASMLAAGPAALGVSATAKPERIVLTWAGDPATTQAVTWRTDATVTTPMAEIQLANDGLFKDGAARVSAQSEDLAMADGSKVRCHSVEFTGLTPSSTYLYRVGDGRRWTEWFQFRTAAAAPAPFTFLFLGDPQKELRTQWPRVWRQAWLTVPNAAFAVITGDIVNDGSNDDEWDAWFQAVGWIGASRPLVLAAGSHEYMTYSAKQSTVMSTTRRLTAYWRPQFTLPVQGPAGLEETCYALDYQGVRFVVLNAQEKRPEQVEWLRQVVAANRPQWTVLAFHNPIFSGGLNRDAPDYRKLWKPVIDELGVDLVLTGHDHVYARSGLDNVPVGYPTDRNVVNGTVYVVAVSGPKYYALTAGTWAVRSAAETSTYQAITVDGGELRYRAWTASGRPFDAFTLKKHPGTRNELVEEMPPSAK